ncbi:MAG: [protein-PII] uridylyltransferase [Planctomycetaceae bacterium]|nr:[protein-PII] uridylyltransferase [Planctomycetaceae bacterium]
MTTLRPNVLAAKDRLAAAQQDFQRRHEAGATGVELCAAMTELSDRIVLELTDAAVKDLNESGPQGLLSQIALVAHGGYGRCDVAPFSDVDLMILHPPALGDRVAPLAERLLRDVFDAGLCLGHSVRTPEQACRLAADEPMICTSLIESRLVRGDAALFARYQKQLRRRKRGRTRWLMAGVLEDRLKEQCRYGETVFLLEPNVKRSRGGLRDFQLIRWIGFLRYGTADPGELHARGLLSEEDFRALGRAYEFLLRLRNELHFHARQAADVLDRGEQLRIAELRGYQRQSGLLPVEQFMRDYFRHTAAMNHIATQFAAKAQSRDAATRLTTLLLGHRVDDGVHVGPAGVVATRRAVDRIRGDLTSIMQLVDLANLYDTSIAPATWEAIRRHACRLPRAMPPPEACRYFLSLLAHPGRLGPLLRDLHDAHLLERFVPEFHHARGLLQFNQYHKYTVDEHCLRAVEFATGLWNDAGPLGRVYRPMPRKYLLHLALLIHDLGKGRLEDHREVGVQIAAAVAQRLGLPSDEAESLRFLVHKHMLMNHLAFRRDTSDEQLAVQLAVQVGSPELLQMLYVLTACDLGAVGPNVWDGWKQEVVTDLYHRTMQHLAGESPETTIDELLGQRREAVRQELGASQNDPWFVEHVDALPAAYFNVTSPVQAAADLRLLHGLMLLPPGPSRSGKLGGVSVAAVYQPDTATIQLTVATSESIIPGIFHRLTGALSSRGLKIRAAEIHTLPDGLVLDRFVVHDPDFAGEPPPSRLEQIGQALVQSLQADANRPPAFRRMWQMDSRPTPVPGVPTRVNVDNSTSAQFTIIDVFTHDRTGLLYAVARELFELGLSVGRAKIGTYLDQVVDVFYVTDQQDCKIRDERRLEEIRRRLLEVAERESNEA